MRLLSIRKHNLPERNLTAAMSGGGQGETNLSKICAVPHPLDGLVRSSQQFTIQDLAQSFKSAMHNSRPAPYLFPQHIILAPRGLCIHYVMPPNGSAKQRGTGGRLTILLTSRSVTPPLDGLVRASRQCTIQDLALIFSENVPPPMRFI